MRFADECTRVYSRRGHSAHLLAPEGTMRTGVLCGAAKRVSVWLGTGSDEERAKAASLWPCGECEYEAWTEDEYRSEDAWGPAAPLAGFAADCARVYAPTGAVAHLRAPFASSTGGGVLCGLELGWPSQWLRGTGSQREYDKAASLPLCGRCLYAANSDKKKFKTPVPAALPAGTGNDGTSVPAQGTSPRSSALGNALPTGIPSRGRAGRPGPGIPPSTGSGRPPQVPAGGVERSPSAGPDGSEVEPPPSGSPLPGREGDVDARTAPSPSAFGEAARTPPSPRSGGVRAQSSLSGPERPGGPGGEREGAPGSDADLTARRPPEEDPAGGGRDTVEPPPAVRGAAVREFVIALPAGLPLLSLNDRKHWAASQVIGQQIKKAAWAMARSMVPATAPPLERVTVTVEYQPPDKRRRDADNLAASGKPAIDGLVLAGVLPDDNSEHVTAVHYTIGPVCPRGRLVLHVRELEAGNQVTPREMTRRQPPGGAT